MHRTWWPTPLLIPPHPSAPTQVSANFSNEPAPARTTEELSSLPVASTNPLKLDAAASAATGPLGNPRRSDGPTGNARGSGGGTRSLRTASALEETLSSITSTASMFGETLDICTPKSEENLRGYDRSRLLGIASALGKVLGRGVTSTSVLGETLGSGTQYRKGILAEAMVHRGRMPSL